MRSLIYLSIVIRKVEIITPILIQETQLDRTRDNFYLQFMKSMPIYSMIKILLPYLLFIIVININKILLTV
jgi:hypothetical protein